MLENLLLLILSYFPVAKLSTQTDFLKFYSVISQEFKNFFSSETTLKVFMLH